METMAYYSYPMAYCGNLMGSCAWLGLLNNGAPRGQRVPPEASASSTSGFSETLDDCVCPDGSALVERSEDGSYLAAKKCVKCAEGAGIKHGSNLVIVG